MVKRLLKINEPLYIIVFGTERYQSSIKLAFCCTPCHNTNHSHEKYNYSKKVGLYKNDPDEIRIEVI